MTRILWPRLLRGCALVLLAGGCQADEGPPAGHETAACFDGRCLQGLVCASQVCVDPDGSPEDSGAGADGGDGVPTGGGEPDDAGDADAGVPRPDAGPGDDGGITADGDADADWGDADADADADWGDADADGGDANPDPDGGDAPPAACVTWANNYCNCLGEVAAPDCRANITDDCANVYDLCEQFYDCSKDLVCSCDGGLCTTDALQELGCSFCE